jgi:DNA-binding NarL/FixJ family response regulator
LRLHFQSTIENHQIENEPVRVVLVGSPSDRARLRAQFAGSADVVGEFGSLDAARQSDVESDALIIATDRHDRPTDHPALVEPLTVREIQVLELLAEGLPNKRIAERLGISDQTVKFHVASISGKLGASNRTDAVRRAVRQGLITL